jgi:hypothetical protein
VSFPLPISSLSKPRRRTAPAAYSDGHGDNQQVNNAPAMHATRKLAHAPAVDIGSVASQQRLSVQFLPSSPSNFSLKWIRYKQIYTGISFFLDSDLGTDSVTYPYQISNFKYKCPYSDIQL